MFETKKKWAREHKQEIKMFSCYVAGVVVGCVVANKVRDYQFNKLGNDMYESLKALGSVTLHTTDGDINISIPK